MINKTAQKGFTLVEVVVVGVLLSVLALGAFSLFNMYVNETRKSATHLKMQRQAEALVDEIARRVRNGKWVLRPGETPAGFTESVAQALEDAYEAGVDDFTQEFVIWNVDGTTYSFLIDDGIVRVSDNGAESENFTIDGTPIVVAPESHFELWLGRKQVRIDVRLTSDDENISLTVQRGAFRCRN